MRNMSTLTYQTVMEIILNLICPSASFFSSLAALFGTNIKNYNFNSHQFKNVKG